MGRLDGRTALVTGGGRGIGRGIVLELAKEGADIVIADVDLPNAEKTAGDVKALGRGVLVVEMDVTDDASVQGALDRAIETCKHVDVLVNNAGVFPDHVGAGANQADWDRCYQVNTRGIWHVSRAMVPHFRQLGHGKIVNIASIAGRHGGSGMAPYNASKAAAISLTQSLAADLGPRNINVNAVCPGLLWTDMWRKIETLLAGGDASQVDQRRSFDAYLAQRCPLRREQTPEDIGKAVAFLASEDARNITGQALNVDGGIEMN